MTSKKCKRTSGRRLWADLLCPKPLEKESIRRPAPVRNFSLPKEKGGHRGKISVVDMLFQDFFYRVSVLSGPLDRLNAILSLLQPLDRYRAPSAIGSAIGRPLSRPVSHPRTGRSPQPPRSKPLSGLNRAIVAR